MIYRNRRVLTKETGTFELHKYVLRTTDIGMYKRKGMGTYELQNYVI